MADQWTFRGHLRAPGLRTSERASFDEAAFRELYASMSGSVFAFAVRRLSPEPAKDIVNETFEVVWRKRRQLPLAREEWPAWVIGIARNKIRQELARQQRRRAVSSWEEHGRARLAHEAQCSPSGDAVAETVVDSLAGREVYRRLSDDERELFDLAHLRCLTPRDGARVLGISVTAYTTRVSRLRMRIVSLSDDPIGSDG